MKFIEKDKQIKLNIKLHDLLINKYDYMHKEIFNEIEQDRLLNSLKFCKKKISDGHNLLALDFGSGTGNLTNHLIELGFEVTCSDISLKLLDFVKKKFKSKSINSILLNGKDLSNITSDNYHFVGAYSVLHHVPNYLLAVEEMIRVCKKGGIIFIDHERSPNFYKNTSNIKKLYKTISKLNLRKFLILNNYISKIKRLINPKYTNEGDIHIWHDDYVDWDKLINIFNKKNCEVILMKDYLTYSDNYKKDKFIKYNENKEFFDTRMIIVKKN